MLLYFEIQLKMIKSIIIFYYFSLVWSAVGRASSLTQQVNGTILGGLQNIRTFLSCIISSAHQIRSITLIDHTFRRSEDEKLERPTTCSMVYSNSTKESRRNSCAEQGRLLKKNIKNIFKLIVLIIASASFILPNFL